MIRWASDYNRFGYRRIRIYLQRDGFELSAGRMHRLWRKHGLQRPRKRPRKRISGPARDRVERPVVANKVWSYDFVFDHVATGQQIKCLTVVDEGTRECLAIDVAGSIRSRRVIDTPCSPCLGARTTRRSAFGQWPGVRIARAAQVDHG